MSSDGLIFLLVAPSGSGKTSIITRILEEFGDIKRFVTFTSRPPRQGERNGVDYFFVSPEQFSKLREAGELIESQEFYGQLYGSSRDQFNEFINGQVDGIAAYDVLGAQHLEKMFPKNIVTVFIIPPSLESVKARLVSRYGNESEGRLRIERFSMEMEFAGKCKYVVNNDNLETAIQNVESIIRAERCFRQARLFQNNSQAGATP